MEVELLFALMRACSFYIKIIGLKTGNNLIFFRIPVMFGTVHPFQERITTIKIISLLSWLLNNRNNGGGENKEI